MRYMDAVDLAGCSYRQADHWRHRGWVHATAEGPGTVSEISHTEASVLLRMAILVRAGMKAANAARIARATIEQGVQAADLPDGLRIVFGAERRAS